MRKNSLNTSHCSGSCDPSKNFFGLCPKDHPFAFDWGKMCCDCQIEKNEKVTG